MRLMRGRRRLLRRLPPRRAADDVLRYGAKRGACTNIVEAADRL
jgi:hypothetical protein